MDICIKCKQMKICWVDIYDHDNPTCSECSNDKDKPWFISHLGLGYYCIHPPWSRAAKYKELDYVDEYFKLVNKPGISEWNMSLAKEMFPTVYKDILKRLNIEEA